VSFRIRSYQKTDFDALWLMDQICFDPMLAYSRPELALYMRRPGAFTLIAESEPQSDTATEQTSGKEEFWNAEPEKQKSKADQDIAETPKKSGDVGKTTISANETTVDQPRIIGFIVAEARRRAGHIITIDVLPEARRSGVGSALLNAVEDRLRQAGAEIVRLETAVDNAAAIQFYKRKEYFVEKTLRGYYSNQLDALVMSKDLTAPEEFTRPLSISQKRAAES
jgi:ribosomal protein S18 acetylase RimI-like enzyme